MSNSRKKVIVRRFSGDTLPGYLPPASIAHNNAIDLLDLTGRILSLPLNDIKTVCYVRDFNLADTQNPERLTRRNFLARPRSEGLWLRLTFRTGDLLEGLAPTDRTLLDALIDDAGLFLTPPRKTSRTSSSTFPWTPTPAPISSQLSVLSSQSKKSPPPAFLLASLQSTTSNAVALPN